MLGGDLQRSERVPGAAPVLAIQRVFHEAALHLGVHVPLIAVCKTRPSEHCHTASDQVCSQLQTQMPFTPLGQGAQAAGITIDPNGALHEYL